MKVLSVSPKGSLHRTFVVQNIGQTYLGFQSSVSLDDVSRTITVDISDSPFFIIGKNITRPYLGKIGVPQAIIRHKLIRKLRVIGYIYCSFPSILLLQPRRVDV